MRIYTDGATSNNGAADASGGWAFVTATEPEHCAFGHIYNATNNICELTAIIKACEFFKSQFEYCWDDCPEMCIIYTDSAYCVNCYKERWYEKWKSNGWVNSKRQPVANRELWEQLIPFFEDRHFYFEKVKGHDGNKFNEKADRLAVAAKESLNG